ncbi:MAG: UDP-N-acetylmuramate--L-alanine ligase [Bacillota bacterium]|nr:UDP-N-acetylmuramate--L-alanine ligase [Bacillota bacterium]
MSYYHFIAIGGAGMSGLARVLLEQGFAVSGSDIKASEITRRLEAMGAKVRIGHAPEHIPEEATTVVVSSAIHEDNPEVVEAKRRSLRLMHRGDLLAMVMGHDSGVAVAGAHGKTTTTSMIAMVLDKADLDPTVLIGGEVSDFGGNAKVGKGKYVVAEADESDGSFLKLEPLVAVITNVDNDHLDFYCTIENVKGAFSQFAGRVVPGGTVVYCHDDGNAREIMAGKHVKTVSYGLEPGVDIGARDIHKRPWGSSFTVFSGGVSRGTIELQVPGTHNVLNALAAVAVGRVLGIDHDSIAGGLHAFKGAQRRLQLTGRTNGVTVLDDYAHHPTEIRASLRAIRDQVDGRVICIYQPHRFSRTLALADDFGRAFGSCDNLILASIYAGPGEQPVNGVDSEIIRAAVERHGGPDAVYIGQWESIIEKALSLARPGDTIVTMGAGDIYKLGPSILERLNAR